VQSPHCAIAVAAFVDLPKDQILRYFRHNTNQKNIDCPATSLNVRMRKQQARTWSWSTRSIEGDYE